MAPHLKLAASCVLKVTGDHVDCNCGNAVSRRVGRADTQLL